MPKKQYFEKGADEVDHVDGCPMGCDQLFIGMTPEDMRRHMVEDHGDPLGKLYVFPSESAKERMRNA